jgi:hypothetical protein
MRQFARTHGPRRPGTILAFLLVSLVAVFLTAAASAGGPASSIKFYSACLSQGTAVPGSCSTSNLPGGSAVPLTVTINNDNTSTQALGSVNVDAPTDSSGTVLLPIAAGSAAFVAGTGTSTQTVTSSAAEIQLRNLNLAHGRSVSVTFTVATPCAASAPLQWTVAAKQSNKFNGSGNDFTLTTAPSALASTVAAGGCKLVWLTQPTSTTPNTLITGTPFDPTGGSAGFVQVAAVPGDCTTSCTPLSSLNGGTVQLSAVQGASDTTASFSGLTASFAAGVATFDGAQAQDLLEGAVAGSGYQLKASSTGFTDSPLSDPFAIGDGENCTATGGNCPSFTSTIDPNTQVDSSSTGGGFTFLAINNAPIPPQVYDVAQYPTTAQPGLGCAYFTPLASSAVDETDGRNAPGGTLQFTYYVDKSLITKSYSSNQGQPFIPICAGVTMLQQDATTGAISVQGCSDGAVGGWQGDALDSNGNFTGALTDAVCYDNAWWAILPSFQDKGVPTGNPIVTGWDSNTTSRYFYVSVPWPGDMRMGS